MPYTVIAEASFSIARDRSPLCFHQNRRADFEKSVQAHAAAYMQILYDDGVLHDPDAFALTVEELESDDLLARVRAKYRLILKYNFTDKSEEGLFFLKRPRNILDHGFDLTLIHLIASLDRLAYNNELDRLYEDEKNDD